MRDRRWWRGAAVAAGPLALVLATAPPAAGQRPDPPLVTERTEAPPTAPPADTAPTTPRADVPPQVRTGNIPAACTVPTEWQELRHALPRMARLVREKQPVRILAIGSSSTAGVGASVPAHAYPPRLKAALERLMPGTEVTVRNDGIGGEVASTTLLRMKRAVEDWNPDVVLWQLGTNDAMRGVTAEAFSGILREGSDFVLNHGRDLVLIDPQFFPGVPSQDVYLQFVQGIERVSAEKRIPLMRRYGIMRFWQALPQPVLMLSEDGFHMNDLGYQCMAEVLAAGIARRVTRPPD
jgi:lysophospholipase L1-like esterase